MKADPDCVECGGAGWVCIAPGGNPDKAIDVVCDCVELDERDDEHERAAARARQSDFEDTDGRDWT